jgi:hypothetical protein
VCVCVCVCVSARVHTNMCKHLSAFGDLLFQRIAFMYVWYGGAGAVIKSVRSLRVHLNGDPKMWPVIVQGGVP